MRLVPALVALVTTSLSGAFAHAADVAVLDPCSGPCLIYDFSADIRAEWLNPSDPAVDNSYLLLPSDEHVFEFKPNESFSFLADIVSEQVIESDPGKDQIFSGLGTYVSVLKAQYNFDGGSIWAGKIHPRFGRAWDITPGIHGTDLAGNYDLYERLGFGAGFGFEAAGMANLLEISAFTKDRSVLSESVFHNRGRAKLSDGGAGNSKGISSVALTLGGCMGADVGSCYGDGSFGYDVSGRYQDGGVGTDDNEIGFVGSLNKSFKLGDDTQLKLFAETGWFRNYDGTADNAFVFTGSSALEIGAMTYSVAYSQQRTLVKGGSNTTEHFVDVTAMYDLGDRVSFVGETWAIGAGYTYDKADGEHIQTAGLKLSTEFSTKIPLSH